MEAADLNVAEPEPSFRFNDATNPRAQLPALAVLGKNHHSLTLIPEKPTVHGFLQPHYGLIKSWNYILDQQVPVR